MPPEQERLRCVLRSHLYRLLADVRPEVLPRCRRLRVRSGALAAVLVIGPAADVERAQATEAAQVGQWLSPMESCILLAIGNDTLQGKQVAAKTGQEYNSTLKVILRNLVDRGILRPVKGEGYQRAGGPTRSA